MNKSTIKLAAIVLALIWASNRVAPVRALVGP